MDRLIAQQWVGHPNVSVIDNSMDGFQPKMERVIKTISNIVNEPVASFQKKFLLTSKLDEIKFPEGTSIFEYEDTITFLVTNKTNKVKWIVKRQFKDNTFPAFYYVDRTYAEKYENRIEKHNTLNEKTYFEFMEQKKPDQKSFKRRTIKFLCTDQDKYQVCTIEISKCEDKEVCQLFRIRTDKPLTGAKDIP